MTVTAGEPLVRGVGITKRWGSNEVLTEATFEVAAGVTGLLGSNGSGKTTLFGMLLGLHSPDAGELRVLGMDPRSAGPEIRQRIGYSPEHEALPGDMPAYDFVRHVAELHGLPRRAAAGRASDALYEVGLGEERSRPCSTMSTGQKQRVKLAQAIVHDPKLVLLDEPTNGLDPVQRDEMLALIRRCGKDLGLSVILSSHLLDEIERTCDRVIIVANHQIHDGGALGVNDDSVVVPIAVSVDGSREQVAVFVTLLTRKGLGVAASTPNWSSMIVTAGAAGATGTGVPSAAGGPDLFDEIRDALVESGLGLRSMRRSVQTLEDRFFEATK